MKDDRQAKLDAVTIGQVRARCLRQLESEIGTLNGMIREGYHNRPKAEKYLNEQIGETLTRLDNLNAFASTEVMFPDVKPRTD